jgi:hypothetical protein
MSPMRVRSFIGVALGQASAIAAVDLLERRVVAAAAGDPEYAVRLPSGEPPTAAPVSRRTRLVQCMAPSRRPARFVRLFGLNLERKGGLK